jgi:hypothetical protein
MVGTAQLRLCPPYSSRICYNMFAPGQSLQGDSHAHIGKACPCCRNHARRSVRAGPDLRSELPDLPADLWPERQLYCVWLYIDGAVQIVRVRPRGAVHRQPVLRGHKFGPNPAATPVLIASVRYPVIPGRALFGANPESRRLRYFLDSGFAPLHRASRGAVGAPRNDGSSV